MGRNADRRMRWVAAGLALWLAPAAPAQDLVPGNGKIFTGFRVSPLTSAITGTDPDIPAVTGQLVEIRWNKLRRVNSWSLKARATLSGCGNFSASALTVRCTGVGPVTESPRCAGPVSLTETFQEIAGGGKAEPNRQYWMVAAYELNDSWRFHALSGCTIDIGYQISSQ